jgi:protoporphyrinogen/coproporphyrinogen III oxidase
MPRVLIVGAGISGLVIAYRLQLILPAAEITVLESRDRPGGTIWTQRQNGFQVEIGPNGFLDNKQSTLDLCRDLGLGDRLLAASEAASKNRYLLKGDRLQCLPNGLVSFFQSDLLSWRGKLAFLLERFRRPRPDLTDESVYAFAARRAGREVADVFADALVTGIHAGDPRLLSIRAAFPRVAALEREYGSVMKGLGRVAAQRRQASGEPRQGAGRMWSFREGMRLLVETLSQKLRRPPLFGVQVRRLAIHKDLGEAPWTAVESAQQCWQADAVVLACPAYCQAALLADVDATLAEMISGIPYNRVAVVGLGFRQQDVRRPLAGFGYIAPQKDRRDLLGVQWCSSIFLERAPEGAVLLRAMCGGWNRPEVVAWDDDRLLAAVRAEIQLALGIQAAPILHYIHRWDRAIPQYQLGHLDRVAWIEARAAQFPGLFLAGNAYHGVALNDCTEQGISIASNVAKYLSTLATV